MRNKLDLTEYSENELSLQVFNDEFFYFERDEPNFINMLRGFFIFTDEQLQVLEKDLKEHSLEVSK